LGGSGKSGSQTTKQELDPRMAPYVFGDKSTGQTGLMDYASGLLGKQMAPGGMPGFDMMKNQGMSLMGGSVAGNPFSGGYMGLSSIPNMRPMGNEMGRYVAPTAPPVQQQAQQKPWSIDEIMAEIERRNKAAMMGNYPGGESGGADGFGGYGGDGWGGDIGGGISA